MSGTATVRRTEDWRTPFEVTIEIPGRKPGVSRHVSGAQAQRYMLAIADEHDLELVYELGAEQRGGPRRISAEDFEAAVTKICAKCREAKPLATFRKLYHRNRTHARGQLVHHGWADRCGDCEAKHGQ